jgi:hypothetical protein
MRDPKLSNPTLPKWHAANAALRFYPFGHSRIARQLNRANIGSLIERPEPSILDFRSSRQLRAHYPDLYG